MAQMAGKVIFVTGGTAGLGKLTIHKLLAFDPAEIAFSGRNQKAADEVVQEAAKVQPSQTTRLSFWKCDISDLDSVKESANAFLKSHDRLDMVVCNAGAMLMPIGTSKQGYENHFATNHLGHAALLKKFIPLMEKTALTSRDPPRVVVLTSTALTEYPPKSDGIDYATLKTDQGHLNSFVGGWQRYGQSKLANALYGRALARKYPHFVVSVVHPGVIKTALTTNQSFMDRIVLRFAAGKSLEIEEGVKNTLWGATVAKDGKDMDGKKFESGEWYVPVGKRGEQTKALKVEGADMKLWDWTQEAIQEV